LELLIRDVSAIFRVPEKTVYHWIDELELPAHRVNDQYRFNRTELMEWATTNKVPLPPEIMALDKRRIPRLLRNPFWQEEFFMIFRQLIKRAH
jgi:excisionase family DNA binding protein